MPASQISEAEEYSTALDSMHLGFVHAIRHRVCHATREIELACNMYQARSVLDAVFMPGEPEPLLSCSYHMAEDEAPETCQDVITNRTVMWRPICADANALQLACIRIFFPYRGLAYPFSRNSSRPEDGYAGGRSREGGGLPRCRSMSMARLKACNIT